MAILSILGELDSQQVKFAKTDHDKYSCDCHETCGLCTEPTLITRLKMTEKTGGFHACARCRMDLNYARDGKD